MRTKRDKYLTYMLDNNNGNQKLIIIKLPIKLLIMILTKILKIIFLLIIASINLEIKWIKLINCNIQLLLVKG